MAKPALIGVAKPAPAQHLASNLRGRLGNANRGPVRIQGGNSMPRLFIASAVLLILAACAALQPE